MDQHAAAAFVEDQLERVARDAAGVRHAWTGGVSEVHGPRGRPHHAVTVLVDRDRCRLDAARALAASLEAAFEARHPAAPALRCTLLPTTRLEHAHAVVREHYEDCFAREPPGDWVSLGRVEIERGWSAEGDRVVVELYAESSADEGAAARLGAEWLERLRAQHPELASLVEVVGASH